MGITKMIKLDLLPTDDILDVSRAFQDGHSFVASVAIKSLLRDSDGVASFRISDDDIISLIKEKGHHIVSDFYQIDVDDLIAIKNKFVQPYTNDTSEMTEEQKVDKVYYDILVERIDRLLYFANEYQKSVIFIEE